MYIVIMPLLLITIKQERGKEMKAGAEKYFACHPSYKGAPTINEDQEV